MRIDRRGSHMRSVRFCFALTLTLSGRAIAAPSLDIPVVTLRNTSIVRFTARPDLTPVSSDQLRAALTVDTERRFYRVRVPIADIPWSASCLCFGYTFAIEDTRSGTEYVFDVRATPAGSFNDQIVEVPFSITNGTEIEKGSLELPLASFRPESPILVLEGPSARRLTLAGPQVIDVLVHNTSDRFPVLVSLDAQHAHVDAAEDFFGTSGHFAQNPATVIVQPTEVATIRVNLTPRSFAAIQASIPPVNLADSHTDIAVKLEYRVGPFSGDRVTFLSQTVKIRFEPTLLSLLLSLCAGASLGVAFRRLSPRSVDSVRFWHALASAYVAAVIIEIVAMLLASGGSKLILLNHDIDPFELLPTAIVGLFSGLNGYNAATWIYQLVKPATPPGPPPAPAHV